jgi:hypothetical protein
MPDVSEQPPAPPGTGVPPGPGGPAGPEVRPARPVTSLTDLGGEQTISSELDDARYYLSHDCAPCAERHFQLARTLGATEEMITQIRAQAILYPSPSGA